MRGRNHKRVPGEPERKKETLFEYVIRRDEERNKRYKDEWFNTVYADYPCSVYLHNALAFISSGKGDAAYEEICWAILKSGGKLTDDERKKFDEVVKERD